MVREEIRKIIRRAYESHIKYPLFEELMFHIEKPPREDFGDYAVSFYVKTGEKLGTCFPSEVCQKIVLGIKKDPNFTKSFDGVEFRDPVFINFFVSKEYLQKQVGEILEQGEKFGQLEIGKGKKVHPPKFSERKLRKVQVEFISANPTGPLTLGNARGGFFGDVLGNVLRKAGFKVEKAYYINDYGMQILALGHSVLKDEEAEYKGDYVDYLSKKIKEKDPYRAGEKAAKIIVEEMIKKTVATMGIKYDEWISETKFHQSGATEKILRQLEKKGFIYEKEDALWFKSSQFGDERDRVLVKKDGWKTYLAGDAALHWYKFEDKKFDKVINIWGADHYGDVAGLQAIVEAIGYKGKLEIILLQFVTLFKDGKPFKMSKRLGTYVTVDELLKMVGLNSARFFFLQRSAGSHLNFDIDLAKEQSEKNPVYYVQYANARICSILRQVSSIKYQASSIGLLNHPSELNLIKQLIRFPEIIEDTAKDYQIQRIPQYALDLATTFHQFYRDCRVLRSFDEIGAKEDRVSEDLSQARLALISATKQVIKNTLDLMGISAPERM